MAVLGSWASNPELLHFNSLQPNPAVCPKPGARNPDLKPTATGRARGRGRGRRQLGLRLRLLLLLLLATTTATAPATATATAAVAILLLLLLGRLRRPRVLLLPALVTSNPAAAAMQRLHGRYTSARH